MTENNKDEFIEIARIKEEFIANASHELKTPIASVRLAAESALTSLERDDGMTKTFLEQILRDSDRMNELISDLLDLSLRCWFILLFISKLLPIYIGVLLLSIKK